ncbi:MAG: ankyrin repeat domain-containing protein [Lentisphaeraceae bacterium]|nr:ankyrin repeat domain-containing protein [Lentisphaeraceae bacterium]
MKNFFILFCLIASSISASERLLEAVYKDDVNKVKTFLAAGDDASFENRYGTSALSIACENANLAIVKELTANGASIKEKILGETPLMIASRTGNADLVSYLIEKEAKVNFVSPRGYTPLLWAVNEGHTKVADVLIKAGADPRFTHKKTGLTPLVIATRDGRLKIVELLLANGCDPNQAVVAKAQDKRNVATGMPPLRIALENAHYELALKLVEAGADPEHRFRGFAALHVITWARRANRGDNLAGMPPPKGSGSLLSLEFAEILLKKYKVNPDIVYKGKANKRTRLDRDGSTPLMFACHTADVEYAKLLHKYGANLMHKNSSGDTPFTAAVGVGSKTPAEEPGTIKEVFELVDWLLAEGHDVNYINKNNESVIHAAAHKHYAELIPHLIKKGADINIWNTKDKLKHTPLDVAKGYRAGNFRPDDKTADIIRQAMRDAGVKVPDEEIKLTKKEYKP